jgi:hypothetical protein
MRWRIWLPLCLCVALPSCRRAPSGSDGSSGAPSGTQATPAASTVAGWSELAEKGHHPELKVSTLQERLSRLKPEDRDAVLAVLRDAAAVPRTPEGLHSAGNQLSTAVASDRFRDLAWAGGSPRPFVAALQEGGILVFSGLVAEISARARTAPDPKAAARALVDVVRTLKIPVRIDARGPLANDHDRKQLFAEAKLGLGDELYATTDAPP